MRSEDITESVLHALARLGYPTGSLDAESDLLGVLGLDSIEMVELASMACGDLGLPPGCLPDTRNTRSVEELARRIDELLGSTESVRGRG
jgi:hypothetical protein